MPIRKAIPGRPVSAKWLNDMAVVAEKNRLARSNLMDGANGEGGTGTRPADYNPLLIFKVTGTTTGGYTFEEVTDPDADGTYTTADSGLSSTGTGLVLVAPAALTLATNDIVLVRRNPLYALRYETLSLLKSSSFTGLTYTVAGAPATFNMTGGSGVWQDITLATMTVGAGTYLVNFYATTEFRTNALGDYVEISVIPSTWASAYPTVRLACVQDTTANGTDSVAGNYIFVIPSLMSIKMRARRVFVGAVTTSQIIGFVGSNTYTYMSATKLTI